MRYRQGFTLMEMIVVLIIIGVCAAVAFPNFTTPTEQARASSAQNNLLAIYSAQKNYFNNNSGNFALGAPVAGTLELINTTLALNIQDDSTYAYDCGVTTANACTAQRENSPANKLIITLTLNQPIVLTASATHNPACTSSTNNCNWCPLGSCDAG